MKELNQSDERTDERTNEKIGSMHNLTIAANNPERQTDRQS